MVVEKDLLHSIEALLEKKIRSEEKMLDIAVPQLNQFIEAELARFETSHIEKNSVLDDINPLNHLFHLSLTDGISSLANE